MRSRLTVAVVAMYVGLSLGTLSVGCARSPTADAKEELIRSFNVANVGDYLFSINEGVTETASALTNRSATGLITLRRDDIGLVLRYTAVVDERSKTKKLYRSDIRKQGDSLSFVATELGTNTVVSQTMFSSAGPACFPAGQFDSVTACRAAFQCTPEGCPLQCEADRTCDNRVAALTCCLKSGEIYSVHVLFAPDSRRCLARQLTPDLDGIVVGPN
jgi:hypothetical protein